MIQKDNIGVEHVESFEQIFGSMNKHTDVGRKEVFQNTEKLICWFCKPCYIRNYDIN